MRCLEDASCHRFAMSRDHRPFLAVDVVVDYTDVDDGMWPYWRELTPSNRSRRPDYSGLSTGKNVIKLIIL